ncbi:MAG: type II secretion system protein GspM [Halorhodospira sp.]
MLWQRQPRERLLLGGAVLLVLAALWYYQLFVPRQAAIDRAERERAEATEQIEALREEREGLREDLEADPEAALRRRIEALREELDGMEHALGEGMPDLIDPEQIRGFLKGLLAERSGVRLVALERLPAEQLLSAGGDDDGEEEEAAEDAVAVYRHPVRLTIEGSYPATVRFLEAVEGLSWELAWEALSYEVTEYPTARIELRLYTLSGHEVWLGL